MREGQITGFQHFDVPPSKCADCELKANCILGSNFNHWPAVSFVAQHHLLGVTVGVLGKHVCTSGCAVMLPQKFGVCDNAVSLGNSVVMWSPMAGSR